MAYPVRPLVRPLSLRGQLNGELPPSLLRTLDGGAGYPIRLHVTAARAWEAMSAAAKADGVSLYTSNYTNSYRPYEDQKRIFLLRYSTTKSWRHPFERPRYWQAHAWYRHTGAVAAVPGTSNHGWGLAIDYVMAASRVSWLRAHADRFGWSWEIQSEGWHLRYYPGDDIPRAVAEYEARIRHPSNQPQVPQAAGDTGAPPMILQYGLFSWLNEGWRYRLLTSPSSVQAMKTGGVPVVVLNDDRPTVKALLNEAKAVGRYHSTPDSEAALRLLNAG